MKVLVTGGAGFIGSHVIDKLIDAGHEVRVLDLVRSPHHEPVDVEHILGDVADLDLVTEAIAGCESVIHLAAVADVNDVVADPERAQRVNAAGTLNVLEAARRAGVRRVVYGSTIWVYSDCPGDAVDEETPLSPPSHLYTSTKLAGELYCRSYAELYGVDYTILRFGIPYGPRGREATVIPAFVRRAEAAEPLEVAGDGRQSRRFVYVEDLAEGVVAALCAGAANRVYNLAGSEAVSVLEIAEAVRAAVGDTGIVHTAARDGDFGGKRISSDRARNELGWHASTSLADGLSAYLDWRRAHAKRRRVLILTADIGEGHDLPARSLVADLQGEHRDVDVEVVDGLREMGRLMTAIVRDGSWLSFNWIPWLFELQYFLLARFPPTRWLTLRLCYLLGARRLRRAIRSRQPDVVISTYPGTTAVLGELRRRGRLATPVVSAITDLAGLRFWAHRGVDLHTVTHRESLEEVERIAGPGSVRCARPPTSPAFLKPRSRADARRALGLHDDATVVVVSGGGWGIGDLRGAVDAALELEDPAVICLAGHNQRVARELERRFGDERRVRLLGFTDRMNDLLAAADALVHSTAGLTVLEAQIRGCPVISYGFAVGHIRANNRAYRRFGLARVARSGRELRSELRRAVARRPDPDPSLAELPSAATLALEASPRVRPTPLRFRVARIGLAGASALLLAAFTLLTDDTYPLLAHTFGLGPIRAVATTRPEVGLLVDVPARSAAPVAKRLALRGLSASFACDGVPTARTLAMLRVRGDEAVPRLDSGGPFHSLETGDHLRTQTGELGLGDHFIYRPGDGFTLGQYLIGRSAGGSPVSGSVQIDGAGQIHSLRPGELVELDLGGGAWDAAIASLDQSLEGGNLRAVSVSALLRSSGR